MSATITLVLLLTLSLPSANLSIRGESIPRCAQLQYTNPEDDVCKIEYSHPPLPGSFWPQTTYTLYYIEEKKSFQHTDLYQDYKVTKSNSDEYFVLRMAPLEHKDALMAAYEAQLSIYKQLFLRADQYHMVPYFDKSDILDNDDISIVFVTEYYEIGNLNNFVTTFVTKWKFNAQDRERFAITSFLTLMEQISVPLQRFNELYGYKTIHPTDIYVKHESTTNVTNFYLGGMEYAQQAMSPSFDVSNLINRLVKVGWLYYSKICDEDVLLGSFGTVIFYEAGSQENIFCVNSKIFWKTVKQNKAYSESDVVAVFQQLTEIPSAHHLLQYQVTAFIADHCIRSKRQFQNWQGFDQRLQKLQMKTSRRRLFLHSH